MLCAGNFSSIAQPANICDGAPYWKWTDRQHQGGGGSRPSRYSGALAPGFSWHCS